MPWCWSVLTLQKAAGGPAEALIARRATLSLLPGVWPASSCASARLMSAHWTADDPASDAIVWHRRWRIDVDELRALYAANCRVRAWLQFGRVPHVADGTIADLRFEHPIGQNFTPMAVETGASRLSRVCDRLAVAPARRAHGLVRLALIATFRSILAFLASRSTHLTGEVHSPIRGSRVSRQR